MVSKQDKQIKFYEFLQNAAKFGQVFTEEEVGQATGWKGTTPKTNLGKQVKDYTERSRGRYTVRRQFLALSLDEFLSLVSQKEPAVPTYTRASYDYIVTYEFLLPLTKEDKLRRALDDLFYLDTLKARMNLIELSTVEKYIIRFKDEKDEEYISRVCGEVGRMFGGYSVTHVGGRFRARKMLTQEEAIGKRYIIDETTAVVRFIVPCASSRFVHEDEFDASYSMEVDSDALKKEIAKIRTLFFQIFVESIVYRVLEEDEIWLLENSADGNRLYKWEKK